MFKADIDLIMKLNEEHHFETPLLDIGGVPNPVIADYSISIQKATPQNIDGLRIAIPVSDQASRYVKIPCPWKMLGGSYVIVNPALSRSIEDFAKIESSHEAFKTIVCTSTIEHVLDVGPFLSAAISVLKSGGYMVTTTAFQFPRHSDQDYWRYSSEALVFVHERAGFETIASGCHIKHTTLEGIGDTASDNYRAPTAIEGSWYLGRKKDV